MKCLTYFFDVLNFLHILKITSKVTNSVNSNILFFTNKRIIISIILIYLSIFYSCSVTYDDAIMLLLLLLLLYYYNKIKIKLLFTAPKATISVNKISATNWQMAARKDNMIKLRSIKFINVDILNQIRYFSIK